MKIRTSILTFAFAFGTVAASAQMVPVPQQGTSGTGSTQSGTSGYGTNQQGTQKITNGPVIEYTSDNSAMIAWSTKTPAGTYLAYGTDRNNLNQRTQKGWGGTNHRLEIKNLQPNTTYYFQVRSENAQGSGADVQSNVASFTTVAKGAPHNRENRNVGVRGEPMGSSSDMIANGPMLEYTSDKDAVIAWTSKTGGNMSVKYGTDRNNLQNTANTTDMGGTNHRAKLSNLQPSTTYYIQVQKDGQPVADIVQFQTVAAGAPPKRENTDLSATK